MKNKILYIIASVMLTGFTSCSDFGSLSNRRTFRRKFLENKNRCGNGRF